MSNEKIKKILLQRVKNLDYNFTDYNPNERKVYLRNLKADLKKAFKEAFKNADKFEAKLKILFIEYDEHWGENDAEWKACLCGFGDDDGVHYPILEEPDYVKFNFESELFNGVGEIKLGLDTGMVKEHYIEEIDLLIRSSISQVDDAFVYLYLHELFEEFQDEFFDNKDILEDEVFIYGNHHDMPASNIFILKKKITLKRDYKI